MLMKSLPNYPTVNRAIAHNLFNWQAMCNRVGYGKNVKRLPQMRIK